MPHRYVNEDGWKAVCRLVRNDDPGPAGPDKGGDDGSARTKEDRDEERERRIDRIVAIALGGRRAGRMRAQASRTRLAEYRWPVMGTFGQPLAVNGEDGDAAMAIARDAVEEVNAALSAFNPTSDVSRVNAKRGSGEFVQTGIHFQTMMAASRQCHDASGGAFQSPPSGR